MLGNLLVGQRVRVMQNLECLFGEDPETALRAASCRGLTRRVEESKLGLLLEHCAEVLDFDDIFDVGGNGEVFEFFLIVVVNLVKLNHLLDLFVVAQRLPRLGQRITLLLVVGEVRAKRERAVGHPIQRTHEGVQSDGVLVLPQQFEGRVEA
jgi:hypothetical protein